ncbi:MAG: TonB-dependent receptor [Pseudomonadales bacterium]|nr:TonB-dependent receptor [Pseudomonadales bacterium]
MINSIPKFTCLLLLSVSAHGTEIFQLSEHNTHVRARSESLQWVPTSVTVLESADINAGYRRNIEDIQGYIPGMIIDSLGSTPQGAAIGIRGIQSNSSSKGLEPAVAVSVDGVYVGTHAGQNQSLFDVQRIEVARGPQGAFTNMPAQGGTINLTRSKPTGEYQLVTRLGFQDPARIGADLILNAPLTQDLAAKFTLSYLDGENSNFTNAFNDQDENESDRTALSVSLLWNYQENISIQYTFDIEDDDSDTPALLNLSTNVDSTDLVCVPRQQGDPVILANCGSGARTPESGSINRTLQNRSNSRSYEGNYHTLRIEAELADYKVVSVTGFRTTEEDYGLDLDATLVDFYSSDYDQDYDQFSTDIKVSTQWSEDIMIMAGGSWLEMEYDSSRVDRFILDQLVNSGQISNSIIAGQSRTTDNTLESTVASGFMHVYFDLDETWNFDIGARVNHYTKDFDHRVSGIDIAGVAGIDLIIDADDDWTEVSADMGLTYKVDESAMLYGRFAIDQRPGGFNDNALSLETIAYDDAESTSTIEIGMKSDWMENKLRLNMALYHTFQDDKIEAFNQRTSAGNIEAALGNISEIEIKGYDLEFEYVARDNLLFTGAYSHIESDYERYVIPDPANPGASIDLSEQISTRRAPSDTYFVTSQYFMPFYDGTLTLFASYRYVTEYVTNPLLSDAGRIPAFTTWNVSASYTWRAFNFRLFSQNLNDKRYLINADQSFASQTVSLAGTSAQPISTYAETNRPRYTGIEITWTPQF